MAVFAGDPRSSPALDDLQQSLAFATPFVCGFANSEQYGNVSKLVLAPGKYLFLVGDAVPGGVIPPESMAVLQVLT